MVFLLGALCYTICTMKPPPQGPGEEPSWHLPFHGIYRSIDIIDYVHGIGNMMTSPIDSNTFHGGTTGAIHVAWLCGPLLESV